MHWWRSTSRSRAARTAVAYAAAGWALIQVASTVMEPLGFPHTLLRPIIILIIAGFCVAVAIASGFDMVRRRELEDAPAAYGAPTTQLHASSPLSPPLFDPPQDLAVAVLAFVDTSPAKDRDHFCEGTAEEIISALNAVRGLRVASRPGSFRFKQRVVDSREIGRLLNVRAVLDGSVREAGDRVRVVAQLVNASDGTLLWPETFDRHLEDIFAIQDRISRSRAQALRVALVETGAHQLTHAPTRNLAAHDFFLRGRQLARRGKGSRVALGRRVVSPDCPSRSRFRAGAREPRQRARADGVSSQRPGMVDGRRSAAGLHPRARVGAELAEAHVASALVQQLLRQPPDTAREFEAALTLRCITRCSARGPFRAWRKARIPRRPPGPNARRDRRSHTCSLR